MSIERISGRMPPPHSPDKFTREVFPMEGDRPAIALEGRLRACRNVLTLGVKTNYYEYSETERTLLAAAATVYYPTTFYADLFDALGKRTFPSYHTYKCVQDKIKQTAMFDMAGIPHPRTRVYYGKNRGDRILADFDFPFIAKIPRGSAMGRGVFLIDDPGSLAGYLEASAVAYIQEYIPLDRDIRVVIIGRRVVHAYWRICSDGEFRSNVSRGGHIRLDTVPDDALALALETAVGFGWDDVGIDLVPFEGRYLVLEANMKYGKQGFKAAGIDYVRMMERLIERGDI